MTPTYNGTLLRVNPNHTHTVKFIGVGDVSHHTRKKVIHAPSLKCPIFTRGRVSSVDHCTSIDYDNDE
jgi:hypothetical protein